jgi:uncharacterized membrane protein YdbT with pleckstrin-like domain
MSYVDQNLMQGEQVRYRAHIHWLIFLQALIWGALTLLILIFAMSQPAGTERNIALIVGGIGALGAVLQGFKAWVMRRSTELAVTSKRVILKTGLVRRNTLELNHSKVESFHVEQGLLGRVFDFGDVIINGTGGGKTPIRNISAPLEFRRQAMEAIDAGQRV